MLQMQFTRGTDAVMLSAETAAGDYPTESVEIMRKIVRRSVTCDEFFAAEGGIDFSGTLCDADSVVVAVRDVVANVKSTVVVVSDAIDGLSFDSVMCYVRERCRHPLVVLTKDQHLARHLALVWGVFPVYANGFGGKVTEGTIRERLAIPDGVEVVVL